MGSAEFGREEVRGAKVTKPWPRLACFDRFMSSFHKWKKKHSLASSFFFFNSLGWVFTVDAWAGFLPFMMTDAWVRGRERGASTPGECLNWLGLRCQDPWKTPEKKVVLWGSSEALFWFWKMQAGTASSSMCAWVCLVRSTCGRCVPVTLLVYTGDWCPLCLSAYLSLCLPVQCCHCCLLEKSNPVLEWNVPALERV